MLSSNSADPVSVVILSSHEFRFELLGENGGEKIW